MRQVHYKGQTVPLKVDSIIIIIIIVVLLLLLLLLC